MVTRSNLRTLSSLLLGLPMALLACAEATGPGQGDDVEIRASARGPAVQNGSTGFSIEIERILVVVGRVKLEKAGTTPTDYVDERSVVVELDPGANPVLAISVDVPDGDFKELEIAVDKLEPGESREQQLIDLYPALRDGSFLVEGRVLEAGRAESFRFVSDLDIDLELSFDPPLRIAGTDAPTTLVSLSLDITHWFRTVTGELLDPRDPASRSAIESNVQKSIELFEGPVDTGS